MKSYVVFDLRWPACQV